MSNFIAEDLIVGYGDRVVVDNVNFNLSKGQVLCLLGPNGSGKSTIIKTLIDKIEKIDGDIRLDNNDIDSLSIKNRARKISIVLTERVTPQLMTGKEVVATGRYPYTNHFGKLDRNDLEIIDNSIELVNANNLKDKVFEDMSDGERQRIMIARAICQESDIMILDEPTSFLDIKYKIELLNILNRLAKEEDKIIIMSLHEIDLVSKVADRVLLINNGKIYKYGSPEEVITDDNIEKVYDLEPGSFNTNIGAIELSKMGERKKPQVFVIGGQGKATKIYRALNRGNIPFASGVIFENDIDYNPCKSLAEIIVINESFVDIEEENINICKKLIDSVDIVIDSGCCLGGINKGNKELLEYASKTSKKLYSLRKKEIENFTHVSSVEEIIQLIKKKA